VIAGSRKRRAFGYYRMAEYAVIFLMCLAGLFGASPSLVLLGIIAVGIESVWVTSAVTTLAEVNEVRRKSGETARVQTRPLGHPTNSLRVSNDHPLAL
jgi:hypothetical protein